MQRWMKLQTTALFLIKRSEQQELQVKPFYVDAGYSLKGDDLM